MSWQAEHSSEDQDPDFREWEINTDGKLWPCCKFIIMLESQNGLEKLNDPLLKDLIVNDPNWNSLLHNDIHDIVNHWAYSEYIHPKGWNSENPPAPCIRFCSKNKKEFGLSSQDKHINRFTKKNK